MRPLGREAILYIMFAVAISWREAPLGLILSHKSWHPILNKLVVGDC